MPKQLLKLAILAALLLPLAHVQSNAQEAQSPEGTPIRIGVVDLVSVRQSSSAMAAIGEQISGYRDAFQADIQTEEASLREANQELSKQRAIVSAEAFNEARKQFEERVARVQRTVQVRKEALEKSREAALRELHQTLNLIVAEIAKERGLTLILRRDQTVLSANSLQITEEVTKRLNDQLPTVTVANPGQ